MEVGPKLYLLEMTKKSISMIVLFKCLWLTLQSCFFVCFFFCLFYKKHFSNADLISH